MLQQQKLQHEFQTNLTTELYPILTSYVNNTREL